jgi:hypothetical protein
LSRERAVNIQDASLRSGLDGGQDAISLSGPYIPMAVDFHLEMMQDI